MYLHGRIGVATQLSWFVRNDILNGAQKPVFFDQSPSRLFTQAGQTFCTRLRIRDASKPVKIALVWTDAPGMPDVMNPLVNDLNLEVRRGSNPSNVYVGNSLAVANQANGEESIAWPSSGSLPFDNVNNVEYFRSFMNANEQFNVTVRAFNIAGDTDGNPATFEQDFALVILNADLVSVGSCDTPPTAIFTITCSDLMGPLGIRRRRRAVDRPGGHVQIGEPELSGGRWAAAASAAARPPGFAVASVPDSGRIIPEMGRAAPRDTVSPGRIRSGRRSGHVTIRSPQGSRLSLDSS